MSDIQPPWVHTESMGRTGVLNTGCCYTMGDKVSSILNWMWGDGSMPNNGWRAYRLAYGVQKSIRSPRQLRWVDISPPQDPTMQELFKDISFKEGEVYYLVISLLDVNNRYIEGYETQIESAVFWLQGLYMHHAVRQAAPASLRILLHELEMIQPSHATHTADGLPQNKQSGYKAN